MIQLPFLAIQADTGSSYHARKIAPLSSGKAVTTLSNSVIGAEARFVLLRRASEGGSWHIRVPLAQTGHWLRGLGRLEDGLLAPLSTFDDIADLTQIHASGFGLLTTVRRAARLSQSPVRWGLPAMPPGSHPAMWV